jgi:rare lipoprotein A
MRKLFLYFVAIISVLELFSFKSETELKTGVASCYHDKFHGRRTASGEPYDKDKFTTAHRFLPFGTMVMVRNIKTGDSVIVKVNDRGPFHKTRTFDLSKAAFLKIGDLRTGPIPVEYKILEKENEFSE